MNKQGDTLSAHHLAEEAEQNALKLLQEGDESYIPRVEVAASYTVGTDPQKALEWLELAYTRGARDSHRLENDLFFDKLHSESGFNALLRRMAMDVAQMRKHAQEQLPDIFSATEPGRAAAGLGCSIIFANETTTDRTLVAQEMGIEARQLLEHRVIKDMDAWRIMR